jgi:uncharacterized membrane protein
MSDSAATVSPSILDAWLQVLAAMHPLVVHFPIALAVVGALAMAWHWICRHEGYGDFAFHCTWIAALASVFVCASGWFFADAFGASNELFWHRWVGIGSSAGLVALAFAASQVRGDSWPGLLLFSRISALVVAIGIGITAHFGGQMVWAGQDPQPLSAFSDAMKITWKSMIAPAPAVAPVEPSTTPTPAVAPVEPSTKPTPAVAPVEPSTTPTPAVAPVEPSTKPTPAVAPVEPSTTPTPAPAPDTSKPTANVSINDVLRISSTLVICPTQTTPSADSSQSTATPPATTPPPIPKDLEYNKNILPILEARCWDCHGKGVAKGGVAFDHVAELISKEAPLKGKRSAIILVGKPESSSMVTALKKSISSKGHMPPKGARLTAEQIALIEAWIQQGAKVVNP